LLRDEAPIGFKGNKWNPTSSVFAEMKQKLRAPHLQPLPLQVDTSTPLPLLVERMPWSDCNEGVLGEVLEYVKKSKYLSLPEEWLGVI